MPNINTVILAGHMTRDPEVKFAPSGTAIASFGIAINHHYKDSKSQEKREEVCFVDIEVFGKMAEVAGQYLMKGKAVLIEGRLKLDQWEDKSGGGKRSKLKVICNRFQFLDGKSEGGGGKKAAPAPRSDTPELDPDNDIPQENIPF